jgi:hypothetical protein
VPPLRRRRRASPEWRRCVGCSGSSRTGLLRGQCSAASSAAANSPALP